MPIILRGEVPVCVRGQGARNIRGGEVPVCVRGQGAYNTY